MRQRHTNITGEASTLTLEQLLMELSDVPSSLRSSRRNHGYLIKKVGDSTRLFGANGVSPETTFTFTAEGDDNTVWMGVKSSDVKKVTWRSHKVKIRATSNGDDTWKLCCHVVGPPGSPYVLVATSALIKVARVSTGHVEALELWAVREYQRMIGRRKHVRTRAGLVMLLAMLCHHSNKQKIYLVSKAA